MRYELDKHDCFVAFDGMWDEPEEASRGLATYLGQPIWKFIDGPGLRRIYEVIFRRVRMDQETMEFPFRCDRMVAKRYMRLQVAPTADHGLKLWSRVVREEAREPVRFLSFTAARSEQILVMCSWCDRVQLEETLWHEIENALNYRHLLYQEPVAKISHGICPDCMDAMTQKLEIAVGATN